MGAERSALALGETASEHWGATHSQPEGVFTEPSPSDQCARVSVVGAIPSRLASATAARAEWYARSFRTPLAENPRPAQVRPMALVKRGAIRRLGSEPWPVCA